LRLKQRGSKKGSRGRQQEGQQKAAEGQQEQVQQERHQGERAAGEKQRVQQQGGQQKGQKALLTRQQGLGVSRCIRSLPYLCKSQGCYAAYIQLQYVIVIEIL